ncbi:MAG: dihydrodipicolinate synthase family protein [Terriglobia bacterium]
MKTRKFSLNGVIPVMVTPFDSSGRTELGALRREAELLSGAGVHGLCVGGMTSEMAGASPEELHLVCKTVVSATDKPVIAGIFPDCTTEAVELASACVSGGSIALLVAPPHYLFSPDFDGLREMFSALRRQVQVPLLFSNSIPTAQVPLSSIETLMREEWIDGVHQAGGNAHLLADVLCLNPRVPVWTGVEDLIYLAFLLGAEGAISALAAISPQDCVALYEATRQGDSSRARELHERLNRLWRALDHPDELLSRIKWALTLRQRQVGVPRSPYNVISGESQRIVKEALERAESLAY